LGNVFVPKGTSVSVNIHALHHDPDLWKDPYTFNPERFAKDGEYEQIRSDAGYPYIPFSHGGRQCIGINLSMTEQRVALIMMCKLLIIKKNKYSND
jgi:cytochrome P450